MSGRRQEHIPERGQAVEENLQNQWTHLPGLATNAIFSRPSPSKNIEEDTVPKFHTSVILLERLHWGAPFTINRPRLTFPPEKQSCETRDFMLGTVSREKVKTETTMRIVTSPDTFPGQEI